MRSHLDRLALLKQRFPIACCSLSLALVFSSYVTPRIAMGEEAQPEELTEIVVTGSRIERKATDTVEPVLTLGGDEIEMRGFQTLGDALNELPAFGVADSSPVGTQSSFGPGQSFVNFFGLGSQRTLTLVNGRRFVGSNTSTIFGPTGNGGDQVDLNLIPTKLIDRTEVVAVGGAPIYGPDAIAGTINVVLKHDYSGLEVDGQYGIAGLGDAEESRGRFLGGHNFMDGRLNITVAGEYNSTNGLLYNDRKRARQGSYFDDCSDDCTYEQQYYPDRRLPGISQTGIPLVGRAGADILGLNAVLPPDYQVAYGPYAVDAPEGTPFNIGVTGGVPTQALKFDNSGNLIPIDFGTPTSLTDSSGGNGFSLTDLSNLLTSTKRYSGIGLLSFDVNDDTRVFGEFWHSHSEGTNLRDQPEYKSGFFDVPGTPAGDAILSVNNPFLTPAARASILDSINNNPLSDQNLGYVGAQDYFYLGRANTDLVTGRVRGQVDINRVVLGVDGKLNLLGDKPWKWEVVGNYGHSRTESNQPMIIEQNFLNAAGAVTDDNPDGVPCLAGLQNSSAPSVGSTCAPLDLFGTNVATQAARDYVTGIAKPVSVNTQKDFTATLTGPLATLPAGALQFSIGFEHRAEHEDFDPSVLLGGGPDPDPTVDSNGDGDPANDFQAYGQSVVMAPINAGYHTNELFGELQADLVGPDMGVPLVYALQFQGALRYVDHSINGSARTWTLGGRWSPVEAVSLRGNVTHSIRSPSLTESAAPAQSFFDFAIDPCDATEVGNGPNPAAREANCEAALAPSGNTPDDFESLSNARSFTQAVAGSPDLGNETAHSWTVGTVFQPVGLGYGLTFSADYVDIRVKRVISSFDADDVLSACYDADEPITDNVYCTDRQRRDDAGQLSYIVTGYVNQDELRYRGIVAQGEFRTRTPLLGEGSSIGLGVNYQYMFELSSTTLGTKTLTDGTLGYSKNKGVLTLNYDNGALAAFVQASYIGPAMRTRPVVEDFSPFIHEKGVVFTNVGLAYSLTQQLELRGSIDNLFGTNPPFPSSGTSDVYFRGALGRYFRFGAQYKFL